MWNERQNRCIQLFSVLEKKKCAEAYSITYVDWALTIQDYSKEMLCHLLGDLARVYLKCLYEQNLYLGFHHIMDPGKGKLKKRSI